MLINRPHNATSERASHKTAWSDKKMRKLPEAQAPGVAFDADSISVSSEISNASHSSLANQRRNFVKKASTKRMMQRPRRTSVSDTVSKLSRVGASGRESVSTRLFGFVSNSLGSIGSNHGGGKKPVKQEHTYLQRLVIEMRNSLEQFDDENDVDVTDDQLENWAIIIYESMSAPSRTFHGVQHVFDISEGADPIQKVSAFFHDVIYYSIDGGLSPAQEKVLHGLVKEGEEKAVSLCEAEFDEATRLVIDMFGFSPGQTLNPFSGLNEFLSAALAIRCLKDTLSLSSLAKIAACIEATIPFREFPCLLLHWERSSNILGELLLLTLFHSYMLNNCCIKQQGPQTKAERLVQIFCLTDSRM